MKIQTKKNASLMVTLLMALLAASCAPKQQPRQIHEGPRDWSVKAQSADIMSAQTTAFKQVRLDVMESALQGSPKELEQKVLQPLGRFVLDAQFVSISSNRNQRLEKAITIFNQALFKALDTPGILSDAARMEWQRRFENTVFANCTVDFKRGCVNDRYFGQDAYTAQILVLIAIADDGKLDNELKVQGAAKNCIANSEVCRSLVDIRYRRLAMAFSIKRTEHADHRLNFAFMKYIRALDYLVTRGVDLGYLTSTYSSIFETLISRYTPKNVNAPEFRQFIENFNPWTYSSKRSEVFRHGSKEMLDLATQCCMYSDEGHFKLSKSMLQGIQESQAEMDAAVAGDANKEAQKLINPNVSFHSMVKALLERAKGKNKVQTNDVLSNLGMAGELNRLADLNSNFYNEYFFIIDRLFKEHLDSTEALRILERMDTKRTKEELLNVVKLYMRVQLAYLTVDTIDFMNSLYHSNINSNMVFSEAITVSRDISIRWMKIQGRLDLLNTFIGSYFNRLAVVPVEFSRTTDLLRSVNRNIHYLSVYPNMIGMTYFLSKNQGNVSARSWWGRQFEIKPESIISDLFDGTGAAVQDVWFRFSSTPVMLSRERLFYAFQYALKTQALETFAVDEKSEGQSDRAKFFELTLGKYLSVEKRNLEDRFMELERLVTKQGAFAHLDQVCKYEVSKTGKASRPATISINFLKLGKQTYTGFEDDTLFGLTKELFSGQSLDAIKNLFDVIEPKLTFVRAIIQLLENHMNESGEMKNHPDAAKKELESIRKIVGELEDRQRQYLTTFFKYRKDLYACSQQMYKVEMMRSYRIEDEERAYLGQIYEDLKSIQNIKDVAAQSAQLENLNRELRKRNQKEFPKAQFKFDRLLSDGYQMSRYDFLMRVKDRVERDIFVQPTEREYKVYGSSLTDLIKPRPVLVDMPAGLERLDIYTSESAEIIAYTNNKEDFINQGIKLFNGKVGAFAEWQAKGDQLGVFVSYLHTLIDLFLMGDLRTNGAEYGACSGQDCITYTEKIMPEEIFETFRGIVELVDLNDFDIENARVMGLDGRVKTKSLEKFIIEETSLKAEPLLRKLMNHVYSRIGIEGEFSGLLKNGHRLADMLTDEKVVIFNPGVDFNKSLARVYGAPISRIIQRAQELFDAMPALENKPEWKKLFNTRLRIDENGQVVDINGSRGREELKVVDQLLINNLAIDRLNYSNKTDNLFDTQLKQPGGK